MASDRKVFNTDWDAKGWAEYPADVVQRIRQALDHDKELSFMYLNLDGSGTTEDRFVHPKEVFIAKKNGLPYLRATILKEDSRDEEGALRTFALARMMNIDIF